MKAQSSQKNKNGFAKINKNQQQQKKQIEKGQNGTLKASYINIYKKHCHQREEIMKLNRRKKKQDLTICCLQDT